MKKIILLYQFLLFSMFQRISCSFFSRSYSSSSSSFSSSSSSSNFPFQLIYGTAWKKEKTKELVISAVKSGFRAIDTACQPKHYNEKGVGDGLEVLYQENIVKREDIFLQTKFTSVHGQDPTK